MTDIQTAEDVVNSVREILLTYRADPDTAIEEIKAVVHIPLLKIHIAGSHAITLHQVGVNNFHLLYGVELKIGDQTKITRDLGHVIFHALHCAGTIQ